MGNGSVTRLLREVRDGVAGAEDRLFGRIYVELNSMAAERVTREQRADAAGGGTTDLVHDAYVRIAGEDFENRRHLFFAYARAMRQILIERARKARALKRGGGDAPRPLHEVETAAASGGADRVLDVIEVADLVDRLKREAPREAEVVTLRFFGGLRDADTAEVLGVDARTVGRDWARAKERMANWSEE